MSSKLKRLTLTGILTAMYVVLSAFFRIPLMGDIKLDLGYVAFAVAILRCGTAGSCFVGGMGVILESLLFAKSGLSITWTLGNLVIALLGTWSLKTGRKWFFYLCLTIGAFIGIVIVKSGLECLLFNIPVLVKIPRSLSAFVADTVCLYLGIGLDRFLPKT